MVYAAIDIGSNAARLLVADVTEHEGVIYKEKLNLIRIPLRLGFESFLEGRISKPKTKDMVRMLKAFGEIMAIYNVKDYYACATSAFREAENGMEVVKKIKKETGVHIEIINGSQEAQIIYATQIAQKLDADKNYLYIDVGGGSTEISYFEGRRMVAAKSFNIGTIRVLHNLVDESAWQEMADWMEEYVAGEKVYAIGSGGNINKIHKMSGKNEKKPVTLEYLIERLGHISSFTMEERIQLLGLRHDRADVIVPALQIFTFIMRKKEIEKIYAPRIGVADGIVHLLYLNKLQETLKTGAA